MNEPPLAVFPGSFDPLTLGHLSLICRAAKLFGNLKILVAASPSKHPMFSLTDRIAIIKAALNAAPESQICDISVTGMTGLLIDTLKELKSHVLVRGLRSMADFDYERSLSGMYKTILPDLEIVMLMSDPALSHITSSLVREVLIHNGDISKFVDPAAFSQIALIRSREGTTQPYAT